MAGDIKGITIEFRGDTTKLDKALRQVKNDAKGIDQQLREVNRALKFNPRNTELLRQKFDLLKQKIDATDNQLREFRAIEAQLKKNKVSEQSAEWMTVRRNIIEAESKLKHFNAELLKMKYANVERLGNSFKTAGANMRTAGMYSSIGAGAMIMSGKKLLEMNSTQESAERKLVEIYKTRMGANKEMAQSTIDLAGALQKQGVIGDEVALSGAQQLATYAKYPDTINSLLPAMNDLLVQQKGYNATADDATSIANLFGKAMMGQTGALKRVGISFTKAQEEVLKYGTEEEKAAMLAEVVTQNVGHMNTVFAQTDEGKLAQLRNTLGDIGERLGNMLLPALAEFANYISEKVMPKVEAFVNFLDNHPGIAKFVVALTAIMAVGGPLLIIFGALLSAIGTILSVFSSIVAVVGALGGALSFLAGPIGIVIAAIAAAIAIGIALYKNWDIVKKKATQIWNGIKAAVLKVVTAVKTAVTTNFNTLKNAVTSVFTSLKSRVSSIWNGIKTAITTPIQTAKNKVKSIINAIKNFFPVKIGKILKGLKLPHFKLNMGSKDFGKLGSIRYPTGIGVNWYKKAMDNPYMFGSATLIGAGEAGDEMLYGRGALMEDIQRASGSAGVIARLMAIEAMLAYYLPKGQQIVLNDGTLLGVVNRGLGLKI